MKGASVLLSLTAILFSVATASALTLEDDCYVYYRFDDTTGGVFADSGPNGLDATFYRALKYEELPAMDASNVTTFLPGPLGDRNIGFGVQAIDGLEQDVMVRIPTAGAGAAALPAAGDTFAVSFWLEVSDWSSAAGVVASYNLNGLEWTIGPSAAAGFVVWSGDADSNGVASWDADSSSLSDGDFSHFVVQFGGSAGVQDVWVNGVQSTDAGDVSWWGSDYEAFTLGGRVLDTRPYTSPADAARLDDFAIISGTVDATDVSTLMTSGASALDARRLAHYTLNDQSGTQITDSSANANHGTLVSYEPTSMGVDARDVGVASRAGVFGNAAEFVDYNEMEDRRERALLPSVEELPGAGEAFTVCFWLKPDERTGWDTAAILFNWANDTEGLGFSVGQGGDGDGSILVHRTDGDASSSDSDKYAIHVGSDGLDLDPTAFHHFAITVDENGDITAMYVDGDYAESTINAGWNVTDEGTGAIGCRVYGGAEQTCLCAYLDDLGVVAGELTETQIELAMAQGFDALFHEQPLPPGDASGDGKVDETDAQILATNWGSTESPGWAQGNFNNDGVVDVLDAAILAANWGTGVTDESTAAVPEPGTIVLMLGALIGLVLRRRR
jgi:hypothetical protein